MNSLRRVGIATLAATALAASGLALAGGAEAAPTAGEHQRLIVGYKQAPSDRSTVDTATRLGANLGLKPSLTRRLATGGALLDLGAQTSAATTARMIAELKADPNVAYVDVDQRMYATSVAADPNDPEYAKQWDLFEDKAGMNLPGAWPQSTGSGVTVAVIDTGYVKHSDVDSHIVAGYDFISDSTNANDGSGRDADPSDPGDYTTRDNECGQNETKHNSSWHGTHVAGTIAASTNNGKGVAGIAYDAKIQPVRVLGKCGGTLADIADAIVWASGGSVSGVPANKTPAKVINMSLGGSGSCSSTYQNAINTAVRNGTTVVVAAGNNNADAANYQPSSCANVISVAASNRVGDKAFYSNFGKVVDLAAPGGETRRSTDTPGTVTTPENGILSTLNDGATTPGSETYKPYMGTSMAAPHIAGLAALMLGKKSELTPAQVEQVMKDNVRALPGTCSGGCGTGLADATKTLKALDGSIPSTVTVTNPGDQWGFKGWAISGLQISATASDGGALTFSATGLPAGLTISTSGKITGTPTAGGTSTVTVTAKEASGTSGSTTFKWQIYGF
ncbi:S8 family peptidase [Kutzneria viridogrisea]|uniref:Serine protease n=1 Tax=Kutzneria viridogrisea TaxID=47990 RepID=A0ABR6BHE0_9PSEU|nr:serine protease [Kutzneria viridogrisea]